MRQAKVVSEAELKRLLAVVEGGRHAARNRVAIMLSHLVRIPTKPDAISEVKADSVPI
jgi:hypothetical protein